MAGDLVSLIPQAVGGGGVLALFGWYTKSSRDDRKEYRDALAAKEEAMAADLAEAKADFSKRLAEEHGRVLEADMNAQTEINDLRRRLGDAETVIAFERAGRREAELELEGAKIRQEHLRMRLKIARGEEVDFDD